MNLNHAFDLKFMLSQRLIRYTGDLMRANGLNLRYWNAETCDMVHATARALAEEIRTGQYDCCREEGK